MADHSKHDEPGQPDQPAHSRQHWHYGRKKSRKRSHVRHHKPDKAVVQAKDWKARLYADLTDLIMAIGM
jgi:hypothetical protein